MKIRIPKFFITFQIVLAGYALFGRGFAYIGYPPLFIGEAILALGLLRTRMLSAISKFLTFLPMQLLALFFIACSIRALCDFSVYKLDTLRDSAIWYYSLFAVVTGAILIEDPRRLAFTIEQFRRFTIIYAVLGPALWFVSYYFLARLPFIPGTTVPVLSIKGGDVVVHLTAAVVFFYLGFSRISIPTILCAFFGLLLIGTSGRAALVVPIISFTLVFVLRPRMTFLLVSLGLVIIAAWIFSFIEFNPGGDLSRQFTFSQIGQNFLSIFGFAGNLDLDGTRQWRLDWWHQIFGYTFHGEHFWTGKGFGINLAVDDGIIEALIGGEPLRSPHNSNLTFLARGGVPLFFGWIILQLSWAYGMLRMIFSARTRGAIFCERVGIFLLTYWVAMVVNMNFDVYLEGPMGGIWFWTIWGYGLALMWLYRYRRESLAAIAPIGTAAPSPKFTPQPAE